MTSRSVCEYYHSFIDSFIFQFRYNFEAKQGEVKIDREFRQRCPRHGGVFVRPLVGDKGGARWVMSRLQSHLMRRFYGGGADVRSLFNRSRNSTGSSVASETDYSYGLPNSRGENNKSFDNISKEAERKRLPLYKPLPHHYRENCEACLFRRCPIPR